jgi:hypothetical protein
MRSEKRNHAERSAVGRSSDSGEDPFRHSIEAVMACGCRERGETGIEFMPDGQRCEFPGCDEPIVQPACGGVRRRYCSHDHRAAARRLRSITRVEAGRAAAPAVRGRSSVEHRSSPLPVWIADPFSIPENMRSTDDFIHQDVRG